jgi:hypothetical protein
VSKDTNSTNDRIASSIDFFPNQLLKLQLTDIKDASPNLKALNHSYCVIEKKTDVGNSYYVRFVERSETYLVMASDLKIVESVSITITFSSSEYQELMMLHGNRDGLDKAIKKKLLGDK